MRIVFGILLILTVCLFIYLIGKKGNVKDIHCDSCINCPMKDNCLGKKDVTKG